MRHNLPCRLQTDTSIRAYMRCYLSAALLLSLVSLFPSPVRAQTPTPAPMPPTPKPATPAQPAAAPMPPAQPPTIPQVAPGSPEFRKGALYGRVLDSNGKPLPEATVALLGKDGKVTVWTKTNAQGEYALPADPMTALALHSSARRGLLEQCARAVGDVVSAPVKMVAGAAANPGRTVKSAAVSLATGTPAPLAAEAAAPVIGDKNLPEETAQNARLVAAQTAVGDGPAVKGRGGAEKGEAQIVVSAPGCKEVRGAVGAYWLEGSCPDKAHPMGMQAWLEGVKLAPATGSQKSEILQEALTLAEPIVDPTVLTPGGTLTIQVRLQSPPGPEHRVRVFAREARKDIVVELLPKPGADKNVFSGSLTLDSKTPVGDSAITIAALREEPVEVKLDKKKMDPLVAFVQRLDDMEAKKPYQYDPRIMASENRLDVRITVLDGKKQTPPPSPASPPK